MNETPEKLRARAERKAAKREEKKLRIAQSTLVALKELGYANTSLRDIAEKSDLSLGMLHYYFEDRSELIIHCVRIYKLTFVDTISVAVDEADSADEVVEAFSDALASSIVFDARTHKLWYDIRTQAMFDDTFRPVVDEIEALLVGLVQKTTAKAGILKNSGVEITYAAIDGVFRYLMQRQIDKEPSDIEEISAIFQDLLNQSLD